MRFQQWMRSPWGWVSSNSNARLSGGLIQWMQKMGGDRRGGIRVSQTVEKFPSAEIICMAGSCSHSVVFFLLQNSEALRWIVHQWIQQDERKRSGSEIYPKSNGPQAQVRAPLFWASWWVNLPSRGQCCFTAVVVTLLYYYCSYYSLFKAAIQAWSKQKCRRRREKAAMRTFAVCGCTRAFWTAGACALPKAVLSGVVCRAKKANVLVRLQGGRKMCAISIDFCLCIHGNFYFYLLSLPGTLLCFIWSNVDIKIYR